MWKGIREFFVYTRKQRNGIYALLTIIGILWFALLVDDYLYEAEKQDFSEFKDYVENWKEQDSIARQARYNFTPFPFDPNKASDSVFKALHLSEKQRSTIINFRNKGGTFYKAADLASVYGIDSAWFKKIRPYIQIERKTQSFRHEPLYSFHSFDPNTVQKSELQEMGLRDWQSDNIISYREKVKPYRKKEQFFKVYGLDSGLVEKILPHISIDTSKLSIKEEEPEELKLVDINQADSSALLEIKGIGPAFASRIVSYRDRLGGFYTKSQLREIYGIDEERYRSLIDQIKLNPDGIKKININKVKFKELLTHPYFDYEVVKNIISFRDRRRPYESLDELKNIELVDEVLFSKIAKYLKL